MKKRERDSFKTPLVVEVMPTGKRFKIFWQFTYHWQKKGWDTKITVPIGFETDFASIPRLARLFIPKLGRWNKAAVIHDYLYQAGYAFPEYNRKLADLIFLDAMKDLGVAKWKRNLMYLSVRAFGFLAWRKRK